MAKQKQVPEQLPLVPLTSAHAKQPFKTPYNLDSFPASKGEKNDQPSNTKPQRSMTIPELLKRHSQGLSLEGKTRTDDYYDGEDDPLNLEGKPFHTLDFVEQDEIRKHVTEQHSDTKKRYEKEQKEKKQQNFNKAVETAARIQREKGSPAPSDSEDKRSASA